MQKRPRPEYESGDFGVPVEMIMHTLSFLDICTEEGIVCAESLRDYPVYVMDSMFGTDYRRKLKNCMLGALDRLDKGIAFMRSDSGTFLLEFVKPKRPLEYIPEAMTRKLSVALTTIVESGYDLLLKRVLRRAVKLQLEKIDLCLPFERACLAKMKHTPVLLLKHYYPKTSWDTEDPSSRAHDFHFQGNRIHRTKLWTPCILSIIIETGRKDLISRELFEECRLDYAKLAIKSVCHSSCHWKRRKFTFLSKEELQRKAELTIEALSQLPSEWRAGVSWNPSSTIRQSLANLPLLRYILGRPDLHVPPHDLRDLLLNDKDYEGVKEVDARNISPWGNHPANSYDQIGLENTLDALEYEWKSTRMRCITQFSWDELRDIAVDNMVFKFTTKYFSDRLPVGDVAYQPPDSVLRRFYSLYRTRIVGIARRRGLYIPLRISEGMD